MGKGSGLESLIETSTRGAIVTKVPNGMKWVGKGEKYPCKGPVDFFGMLLDGSRRLLVFDAKECALPTRFDMPLDHVPEHQRKLLMAYGEKGAVSGLLIEAKAHRRLFWMPWTMLRNAPPSYPWDHPGLICVGPSWQPVNWGKVSEADRVVVWGGAVHA